MYSENEFTILSKILTIRIKHKVTWVVDGQRAVCEGTLISVDQDIDLDDPHKPRSLVLVVTNVNVHRFGDGVDWFEPKTGIFRFVLTKGFFPEMIDADGAIDCVSGDLLLRVRPFGWTN